MLAGSLSRLRPRPQRQQQRDKRCLSGLRRCLCGGAKRQRATHQPPRDQRAATSLRHHPAKAITHLRVRTFSRVTPSPPTTTRGQCTSVPFYSCLLAKPRVLPQSLYTRLASLQSTHHPHTTPHPHPRTPYATSTRLLLPSLPPSHTYRPPRTTHSSRGEALIPAPALLPLSPCPTPPLHTLSHSALHHPPPPSLTAPPLSHPPHHTCTPPTPPHRLPPHAPHLLPHLPPHRSHPLHFRPTLPQQCCLTSSAPPALSTPLTAYFTPALYFFTITSHSRSLQRFALAALSRSAHSSPAPRSPRPRTTLRSPTLPLHLLAAHAQRSPAHLRPHPRAPSTHALLHANLLPTHPRCALISHSRTLPASPALSLPAARALSTPTPALAPLHSTPHPPPARPRSLPSRRRAALSHSPSHSPPTHTSPRHLRKPRPVPLPELTRDLLPRCRAAQPTAHAARYHT